MYRENHPDDDSPTDELPILSEHDVVDLEQTAALRIERTAKAEAASATPASDAADVLLDATDALPLPIGDPPPGPSARPDDSRAARLEARIAELEALLRDKDAQIASLDERLRATRAAVARRDETIRTLDQRLAASASAGSAEPASPSDRPAADEKPAADSAEALEAELERSREHAAALAAYIDCRRDHWLEVAERLSEQRERVRALEREIEQRALRERQAGERADAEAQRAARLADELAVTRALLDRRERAEAAATALMSPRADTDQETAILPAAARTTGPALVCLATRPPREYPLRGQRVTIGRGARCDIRIVTHFISRAHARITRDGTAVRIEDLGSRNGVFVNGDRVSRQMLRDGDLVTIGETRFQFRA